jgi:hypothetical protein
MTLVCSYSHWKATDIVEILVSSNCLGATIENIVGAGEFLGCGCLSFKIRR